ncbi:Alpha/beta knot methyltransferase, partial [Gaertneriomyces semiglobifer]
RLPLILCASLIEKPPNLGGLCRTLEIFGCRELLVHSKSVVRDPGFANTAVTAHHHLPISEVKVENLIDYLRNIKKMGYTVIGIEQCDRSSTLETFVFPEKAVILLGKEREGLPVEILREVQCVVEIPQFGVVRSLNVHVSGALVVWEYVKQ